MQWKFDQFTKSSKPNSGDHQPNENSDKPNVIVQYNQEVNRVLTEAFPQERITRISDFSGIQRTLFQEEQTPFYSRRKIHVDKENQIHFLERKKEHPLLGKMYSENQIDAIKIACQQMLVGVGELINQQDFRDTDHEVYISLHGEHPEPKQNWSGQWHQDGNREDNNYPFTTVCYFNYVNISSTLSFTPVDFQNPFLVNLQQEHLISTDSGCIVTFNNRVVKHRVRDVHRQIESNFSNRSLAIINYLGRVDAPSPDKPLESPEKIVIKHVSGHSKVDELLNKIEARISALTLEKSHAIHRLFCFLSLNSYKIEMLGECKNLLQRQSALREGLVMIKKKYFLSHRSFFGAKTAILIEEIARSNELGQLV